MWEEGREDYALETNTDDETEEDQIPNREQGGGDNKRCAVTLGMCCIAQHEISSIRFRADARAREI